MKPPEVVGLDVGKVRTGLARGSMAAKLAEPMYSIPTAELTARLKQIIAKSRADILVVGLPRNLDGRDTQQTTWTRAWVNGIKKLVEVPIYWQDEALTTHQANSQQPKAKSLVDEHALAAATILQDFLDSREDLWVAT
ncbi:hypothetical protein A2884_01265 [Candidatus Saccharibacteria bacterium RIFCSPHIGHO2_01_FULL_48_12]|nr:MAG: hypothetical protein A2884_01265 [Candidatus Saccharibacteria bacterium RIFCSPHIGHO2_01_FULL_48_12]OGL36696.1 MAG: hypothetical protein A3F38_01310 [Candidatus Saccharibacteria bacterium RIFCSPHIGHO2_12_FULL_48_21]